MENFINLTPLIAGMYLVFGAMVIQTKGLTSAMVFKVIPMFLGIASLFTSVKLMGWV